MVNKFHIFFILIVLQNMQWFKILWKFDSITSIYHKSPISWLPKIVRNCFCFKFCVWISVFRRTSTILKQELRSYIWREGRVSLAKMSLLVWHVLLLIMKINLLILFVMDIENLIFLHLNLVLDFLFVYFLLFFLFFFIFLFFFQIFFKLFFLFLFALLIFLFIFSFYQFF